MAHFNSIVLVGRVTRSPELRCSPSGTPVCTFTVATTRRTYERDGQKSDQTMFLDVDAWRRLAELCAQFITKGHQVLVMGALRQSRWTDPRTREPRFKLKVIASQVQFLGDSPKSQGSALEGYSEGADE